MSNDNEKAAKACEAELAEELRRITEELAGAESDAQVEKGLKRLNELEAKYADSGKADRRARELIALVREKLEKLREYTARKRRVQEGELMRKKAHREEAVSVSAAAAAAAFAAASAAANAKDEAGLKTEPLPDAPEAPAHAAEKAAPPQNGVKAKPAHGKAGPARCGAEWNRAYRLTAHMAQSVLEDASYFEKLRKEAAGAGPRKVPPDGCAESHFKTVHSMNVKLVNTELKIRALAQAYRDGRPVAELFKSASNEIKGFMQGLKNAKEQTPVMKEEYDRLFGGWAERFAGMELTKGGEMLEKCLSEQRHGSAPEARRENLREAADGPAPQNRIARPNNS